MIDFVHSYLFFMIFGGLALLATIYAVFRPDPEPDVDGVTDSGGTALTNARVEFILTNGKWLRRLAATLFCFLAASFTALWILPYWRNSMWPGWGTCLMMTACLLIPYAIMVIVCRQRSTYESRVFQGGAATPLAGAVVQTIDHNRFAERVVILTIALAVLLFTVVYHTWSTEAGIRLPSPSTSTPPSSVRTSIRMPVTEGAKVHWLKADQRSVVFPIQTGVQWFMLHDDEKGGIAITPQSGNKSLFVITLEPGNQHRYTFHKNLSGVKVWYETTTERTDAIDLVPR